jgi:hypothetical protein
MTIRCAIRRSDRDILREQMKALVLERVRFGEPLAVR